MNKHYKAYRFVGGPAHGKWINVFNFDRSYNYCCYVRNTDWNHMSECQTFRYDKQYGDIGGRSFEFFSLRGLTEQEVEDFVADIMFKEGLFA